MEFLGIKFVVGEPPPDLRQKARRIIGMDETVDGGAVVEAYQMPNAGPVYITRVFNFTKSP